MNGKQIESRASICQARLNMYIVKSVFSLYHWVPQFEGEWNISFPQCWEDNICRLNQNEQLCPPTYLPNHVPNFPRDLGLTQPTTCSINFMVRPSHPSIGCYKPSHRPPVNSPWSAWPPQPGHQWHHVQRGLEHMCSADMQRNWSIIHR